MKNVISPGALITEYTVAEMTRQARVSPAFVTTYFCNHCNIRFDPIPVKVIRENLPKDHYVQVSTHGNTSKYVDTVTILKKKKKKKKLEPKRPWLQDDLWPHFCWGHTCDSSKSHENIRQSMRIQLPFFPKKKKPWTKRHWPLDDLWPQVFLWLCARIIVSKSHENTSKHVDTVTLFSKTWTKGQLSLYDLWPHSVEVTCVTLPKDHCVQVPWKYINVCGHSDQFTKYHILHILRTYYVLHTMYRMSDHIVSFWT